MNWKNGVYTALVTPFDPKGKLDLDSFSTLVEDQCRSGVSGIVLWGSTGEGLLLTENEKIELLGLSHEIISEQTHKPQVVLNVGGSNTAEMKSLCRKLEPNAFDAVMIVTPPYVKPPIEGLIAHISTFDIPNKPVMYYHIPGRTSRTLSHSEMNQLLMACPTITAVKEASGTLEMLEYLKGIRPTLPQSLTPYIGDDPLYLDTLKADVAEGVVSVVSNAIPKFWQNLNADHEKEFSDICQVIATISSVPNPIGIKQALYKLGLIKTNVCRLPLISYDACKTAHEKVSPQDFAKDVARLEKYR